MSEPMRPLFSDVIKSIPGVFGIRLEEEPDYDVIEEVEEVQIRHYKAVLLASLTVPGNHDAALDEAFDRLAGYIYGNNTADQKMPMTSPVFQADNASDGEKLSSAGAVLPSPSGDGWTVSFFLSNSLNAADAPAPRDPSIRLVTQPSTLRACIRYNGNNTAERRADARQRLLAALAGNRRWRVVEDVAWAQYDQPFAIPFLKRNEAQVAVEELLNG